MTELDRALTMARGWLDDSARHRQLTVDQTTAEYERLVKAVRAAPDPALDAERLPIDRLSDTDAERLYAAYETVMGDEARTIDGKRRIVEPLYRAASDIRLERIAALAREARR